MRVRVPKALMDFLEGTQDYAEWEADRRTAPTDAASRRARLEDPVVYDLIAKVFPRRNRASGASNAVDLTDAEVDLLLEYTDYMLTVADDAERDDPYARAERRAGRKFARDIAERRRLLGGGIR